MNEKPKRHPDTGEPLSKHEQKVMSEKINPITSADSRGIIEPQGRGQPSVESSGARVLDFHLKWSRKMDLKKKKDK